MRNRSKQHAVALSLSTAILMSSLLSGLAHEKWPAPTPEAKREAEETKRYEEQMRRRLEPELKEWSKKGKPWIPSAAKPDDLLQATVPAFAGAEGAGKFSFGGRGGKVYVVTSTGTDLTVLRNAGFAGSETSQISCAVSP